MQLEECFPDAGVKLAQQETTSSIVSSVSVDRLRDTIIAE